MFKTNLKIARRNLAKNKMYTLINVTGLAVSLTIWILITLFIRDELSFDKNFEGGEKVFRIAGNYSQGSIDRVRSAETSYLVKPLVENDIEGLESITRADFVDDIITVDGDKQYAEYSIVFADSTFFDVFRIPGFFRREGPFSQRKTGDGVASCCGMVARQEEDLFPGVISERIPSLVVGRRAVGKDVSRKVKPSK